MVHGLFLLEFFITLVKLKHSINIMRDDFLVFGSPLIGDQEIHEVMDSLKSGWLGTGPKVKQFETDFSKYTNGHHAVAVNSCTAALHLSLLSSGVGIGDEVITTPLTFCATINAIIHTGATPVLADCDPKTYCIDPKAIEKVITKNTKAILPVHFAGMSCDMPAIMNIAEKNNLLVIEDCAHAIETTYNGQHVGTFGDFGCFSFYATKNVVTGEGGMVLTKDKSISDHIKVMALHGMSATAWSRFSDSGYKHYEVIDAGFKYNMTDIQAAIGIHQLARVEESWKRRKEIWDIYNDKFKDLPIILPPPVPDNIKHAYHLYTMQINKKHAGLDRDEFLLRMTEQNIGVGVHYKSIPTHSYYKEKYNWKLEDYPNSYRIGEETISIPLSAKLSNKDMQDVVNTVCTILE